mmetsp:Transcript_28673/g.52292  ORF Transcript_28673/g.52292 Transcript_28673/m.52292 type:complete len:362 (+) Transcript_28673:81-1166(+)
MHQVTLLFACLASKGLGQSMTSARQLPIRADADSIVPAEGAAGALNPLKAAVMLVYALTPRSAFALSGKQQIDNPIFAGRGLVTESRSHVLQGTHRLGTATMLTTIWQPNTENHLDKINVPKKKKKLNPQQWKRSMSAWVKLREKEDAEFIAGYKIPKEIPEYENLPEVTFSGRSNVGKSSALNLLVGGKNAKLAITSKTPGRTRAINLFKVGKMCTVTDLPGYGFAKVNNEMQKKWNSGIKAYLRYRKNLKALVLLVDARREPQKSDAEFLDFLEAENVPTLVIATKIDKVKDIEREKVLHRLYASLALPEGQPIPFSAVTGEGKMEVWRALAEMCHAKRTVREEVEVDEKDDIELDLWR